MNHFPCGEFHDYNPLGSYGSWKLAQHVAECDCCWGQVGHWAVGHVWTVVELERLSANARSRIAPYLA